MSWFIDVRSATSAVVETAPDGGLAIAGTSRGFDSRESVTAGVGDGDGLGDPDGAGDGVGVGVGDAVA